MHRLLLLVILFSFGLHVQAAIDSKYKECSQRGYSVEGEYCVFPDESSCLIDDFNAGTCGQQWMTDDYCIEEGGYVWDEDKCCDGLVAYLPKGAAGQATCQPQNKTLVNGLLGNPFIWLGLLVVMLFFLIRMNRK